MYPLGVVKNVGCVGRLGADVALAESMLGIAAYLGDTAMFDRHAQAALLHAATTGHTFFY